MKKLRISSLILAILMIVSMIPMMALSVLAEGEAEETPFPELPETLPGAGIRKWDWYAPMDGTVQDGTALPFAQFDAKFTTQMLVDYTKLESDQVQSSDETKPATIIPGYGLQGAVNTTMSLTDGLPEENAHMWRGASGLLIAVDTMPGNGKMDVVTAGAGWHLKLEVEMERISLSDSAPVVDTVTFASSVNSKAGWQSYYYVYVPEYVEFQCAAGAGTLEGENARSSFDANSWNCEIVPSTNARIIDNFQGYIYLPFDCSFYCHGAGARGSLTKGDTMTFNDAAEIYDDIRIKNITLQNAWSQTGGACFRNIQLVFAEPTYNLSEYTQTEAVEGEATLTASGTPAVVETPLTMKGADGIRFHVDASAVNAPVQLRLNLISEIKKNESKWAEGVILTDYAVKEDIELGEDGLPVNPDEVHYVIDEVTDEIIYPYMAGDTEKTPVFGNNQFVTLTSDEVIRTISRGYDCLMFYYDAEGNPIPLTATSETDIFAALPAGYVGDVYIPASSFYASITDTLQIPIKSAEILDFASLSFEYESAGTGNVVISDIELCLTNAYVDGASITLDNAINLNVYAVADECYGNFSMDFYKDGVFVKNALGVLVDEERDLYKFTLSGITLVEMTETFSAVLKLNGELTDIKLNDYSVAEYVAHILAIEETPAAVKTALVDLLYYGDAMMNFAAANAVVEEPEEDETEGEETEGEETEEEEEEIEEPLPLPTTFLTEDQKALRSADGTLTETGVATRDGEEDELFVFTGADVDFNRTKLSFDFKAFLDDEIGVAAKVTRGEETFTYDASVWGVRDGFFAIRVCDISFADLGKEMTVALYYGEEQCGQSYTVTALAALAKVAKSASASAETKECARSLYNLGVSVAALVNA